MKRIQPFTALVCVFLTASPWMYAQQNETASQGHWYDRVGGFTGRYQATQMPPINVTNSARLESLVRAGKLYLSLQDAIAAALENNIDIEIERYTPQLAAIDLTRAKTGTFLRGISTNVTTGSASAGGSGIFGTPGTPIGIAVSPTLGPLGYNLDPVLTGTIGYAHTLTPQTNTLLTGSSSVLQTGKTANIAVSQGFLTGTTAAIGYNNNIASTNSPRSDFSPYTASNMDFSITQHLLQGFGIAINNRNIRIAKNDVNLADLVFKQQVVNIVANVTGMYWDLVAYNENVSVQQQALAQSQKLYNDNKKQVEVGTLAPIEIVRAEAEVAADEQALVTAQTIVLQQEAILKNAISRNGIASPTIAEVRVVPTDRIRLPAVEAVEPMQDLVAKALDNRPELGASRIELDSSRIALKGVRAGLLPTLDAYGDFRSLAQAGTINPLPVPNASTGVLGPRNTGSISDVFVGGYGAVLGQLFGWNFPNYSAGFQLNIPLRNRAAQADYATAQVNLRQAELQVQRQINGIRLDVQNALTALQQARARYTAAEKSRILQEQTLDAEQKKYALGASTVYNVILAQRDLATAEGTRVQALAAYAAARTQLELVTGSILEANNIQLDEAKSGHVSKPPAPIPVVDTNGNPIGMATPLNPARKLGPELSK